VGACRIHLIPDSASPQPDEAVLNNQGLSNASDETDLHGISVEANNRIHLSQRLRALNPHALMSAASALNMVHPSAKALSVMEFRDALLEMNDAHAISFLAGAAVRTIDPIKDRANSNSIRVELGVLLSGLVAMTFGRDTQPESSSRNGAAPLLLSLRAMGVMAKLQHLEHNELLAGSLGGQKPNWDLFQPSHANGSDGEFASEAPAMTCSSNRWLRAASLLASTRPAWAARLIARTAAPYGGIHATVLAKARDVSAEEKPDGSTS